MVDKIRFFSLNKASDWLNGCMINLEISNEGLALCKKSKYATSKVICLENLDAISEVTDFTVGNNGQIFLLDDHANLYLYDYQNDQLDLFFSHEQGYLTSHAFISFIRGTIYAVDPFGNNKVLAFSALNGQIFWSLEEYQGLDLLPLSMATDESRNVYMVIPFQTITGKSGELEVPAGGWLGVVKINLTGKVSHIFAHERFKLHRAAKIVDLLNKYLLTVTGDGSVYVLNTEDNTILRFPADEALPAEYNIPLSGKPSGFGSDSGNHIYIGDGREIARNAEDDRFIYSFASIGEEPEIISGYRGRTDKLLFDQNNRLYIWNKETGAITILELKQKVQEMSATGLPHGIYLSASLDSAISEVQWHKMTLDAEVPENTQIRVSYFASDRKAFKINNKLTDMDEYIQDDTVPPDMKISSLEPFWSVPVSNPEDALVHNAAGRYFWLKIEFMGNEAMTPVLKKVRVYYPRMSYLRYLPAIYQEDTKSRDFLERFLSLFEAFLSDMEEKIGNISKYFDVDAVSGPFLQWLATWLAIFVDDSWSEAQLKQLLKRAPELYRKRGTKQGIEEIIEIYTGEKPFIIEHFQCKHLREQPELKDMVARLYGTDPYCFCVLVKQECVPTTGRRLVVQQILDREKPAFTEAKLIILQPWVYMDMHTYLGINTYLSELSLLRLDQESSIPYSTVVIDVNLDNRVGLHSRVGLDSELK